MEERNIHRDRDTRSMEEVYPRENRAYIPEEKAVGEPLREIPEQILVLAENVQSLINNVKTLSDKLSPVLPQETESTSEAESGRPVTTTTYGGQIEEHNYRIGIVNKVLRKLIEKAQV